MTWRAGSSTTRYKGVFSGPRRWYEPLGAARVDRASATLAQRRAPPVLTKYLGMTVGGTLSAGGSASRRIATERRSIECTSLKL